MKTERESPDVLVFIERDGTETLKIRSDQLEQIGHKLRGFSVFNSIILPLVVSAATVFFTGLFQYISWTNSVRLQEATDIANRAMKSSEEVTAAIGERYYATYTFMAALRELVAQNFNPETPTPTVRRSSETTGSAGGDVVEPEYSRPTVGLNAGQLTSLSKLNLNLNEQRFEAYYKQIKKWNESIDTLLTEVDYTLDRPIFMLANSDQKGNQKGAHKSMADYYQKMKEIDCAAPLTNELIRVNLDTDSLRLRLVGINYCFMKLNAILREHTRTKALAIDWTDDYHQKLEDRLTDITTMATQLHCYALHRVDYYNNMKEQSIISPFSIWRWLTDGQKEDAQKHFKETAILCDPETRRPQARAAISDSGR
jgi:hypothetical protein